MTNLGTYARSLSNIVMQTLDEASKDEDAFVPTDGDFAQAEVEREKIDFDKVEQQIRDTFKAVFGERELTFERTDQDDTEGFNTWVILVDNVWMVYPTLAVTRRPTIGQKITKLEVVWTIDRMTYNPGGRWEPPDTDYENLGYYQNLDECVRGLTMLLAQEILDSYYDHLADLAYEAEMEEEEINLQG